MPEQARIQEFCEAYRRRVELPARNHLFLPSLRNWCTKYGTNEVIEKLESISGYVRKAQPNAKINYMQTAIYKAFDSSNDNEKAT